MGMYRTTWVISRRSPTGVPALSPRLWPTVTASCGCFGGRSAQLVAERRFCSSGEEDDGDSHEAFCQRRFQRVQKRRQRMFNQVDAAHDPLQVFYSMARRRLVATGRMTSEEAERHARIDERLFALQRSPEQLESYTRNRQFHPDWVEKKFALKPRK